MVGARLDFPGGNPRRELERRRRAVIEGTRRGVIETAQACERRAKQNLTAQSKVDRGLTRASIAYEIHEDTVGLFEAVVFCGAYWGIWIENGRRGLKRNPKGVNRLSATAAFPPIAVIAQWVQRNYRNFAPIGRTRGGRARPRPQTRGGTASRHAVRRYDRAVQSIAFLIGRKIRDYGIPPAPFMLPAFREQAPLLEPRILYWIKRLSKQ